MAEGCQLQSLSEETLCLGAGPAVVFPLPHMSCAGGSSSGQVLVPHCWPLWAGKGDIAPASSVSSAPERGALLGIFFSPRERSAQCWQSLGAGMLWTLSTHLKCTGFAQSYNVSPST